MSRFVPTKGTVHRRLLRLASVMVVTGVLLTSVPASARQGQELSALLSVQVVESVSGQISVVADAELVSGRTAKVATWSLSLIEIIPDDGRGGEGGVLVESVQVGARDLPLSHIFVVDADEADYYVVLEAVARPTGRQRTGAQMLLISQRTTVDCRVVAAC